jgi:predicted MFS family arabinose efflux permease
LNALSWLIYLASVVSSIGVLAFTVAVLSVLVFLAGLMVVCANIDEGYESERNTGFKLLIGSTRVFVICALLLVVLPGRDTIYAIAASEMGEELLNSETGSKAVKALDAWLDRQIADDEDTTTD